MAPKINAPRQKQKHPQRKSAPNENKGRVKIAPKNKKASSMISVEMDINDWDFYQVSALTSVPVEDDNHTIPEPYIKFINANGHVWRNQDLKKYYQTYFGGFLFVEHEQDPDKAYGIILDARLRRIKNKKIGTYRYTVELLQAIAKRGTPNDELAAKIAKDGEFRTSMGCASNSITCSICGNISVSDHDMCSHVVFNHGKRYMTKYGYLSKMAELVTPEKKDGKIPEFDGDDFDAYPISFYENSIVSNPAYLGAVPSYKYSIPKDILVNNKIIIDMPLKAYKRSQWNALKYWERKGLLKISK